MRAAFMTDVNAVEVREDAAEPALDPAGALLRVEACGICGTDARTFFNGDPKAAPPWQLGHEPVGVLEEVGPDADAAAGDRGGRPGLPGLDPHVRDVPLVPRGVPEPLRAPPAVRLRPVPRRLRRASPACPPIATKNLIPLPPELPSDLATVADPFACALNGIEQLDVRLGDTVVILGTGPIGCWQAVMARDRGASKVFMTDVSGERLKIALDAIGAGGRRRVGGRRGQRGRGGPAPDGRSRRRARERRGAREARPAGGARDGREARGASCTSRACRSTTR